MELNHIAAEMRKVKLSKSPSSLEERKRKLSLLKTAILDQEKFITEALRADLGKSPFESYMSEVGFILEEINYALKHLFKWTKRKRVRTPLSLFPAKSYIYPEPYGVVLIVSPWNYPFQLCLSPFIGAIAAGNSVVIKPSEYAPKTSEAIRILLTSVFNQEEVQVIEGGPEITEKLIHQKFDYLFFTGSTPVGRIMMKAAAEHLTPVTLELGGKSPCIIEESANLDLAARRCAWGKFMNAGQTCVAPDYVVIPRRMQDEFILRMKTHLSVFYGDNIQESSDYSRIINEKHMTRLQLLLPGNSIAIGGVSSPQEKFFAPTVLRDVSWNDQVMKEEIFGPVLPLVPYDNLEEVLFNIKSLPKPLAFYVFSQNQEKAKDIINQVSFGGGCINDTLVHLVNPNLPFGGVGASGMGSYHGKRSFDTFTHYKSVINQFTRMDNPVRYPPYKGKLKWLKLFLH
jgi:aldehyde dehydrogenase (NAD+)